MRILFLFQTAEHVRFRKRAELLIDEGLAAMIMAFERNSYPMPALPCPYRSLGSLSHRNYLKRVFPFLQAIGRIRAASMDSGVIYCFGLDMLLLGWLAATGLKKALVYEVGDIREVLTGKGLKSSLFRWLERFLLGRTGLLVVTSEPFVTGYFNKIQGLDQLDYQVVENKLDRKWLSNLQSVKLKDLNEGQLWIGYFGVLRCRRSWELLQSAAAGSACRIRVYIRGISREIDLKQADNLQNMVYDGTYVSPDQLPEIYSRVDMVWACYPYRESETGNWQWAKTVRFYEACYFQKPLIVQAGTEDSRLVEKYDLGLTVDMGEAPGRVKELLEGIKVEDLERWKANLSKLPQEVYLHTDEHAALAMKLKHLAGRGVTGHEQN